MKLSNLFKALCLFLLMGCAEAQEGICGIYQDDYDKSYYLNAAKSRIGSNRFTYKSKSSHIADVNSYTRKITSKLKPGESAFVTVEVTQEGIPGKYQVSKKSCRLSLRRDHSDVTVMTVVPEGSPQGSPQGSSQITPTLVCPEDVKIFYGANNSIAVGRPINGNEGVLTYHIDAAQHSTATIDDQNKKVMIHGVGEAMIQVNQKQYGNYKETSCQYKLTVNKGPSVITFPASAYQTYPPVQQILRVKVSGEGSDAVQPTRGTVSLYDTRPRRQLASAALKKDGSVDLSLDLSGSLSLCTLCFLEVVYDGGWYHTPSKAQLSLKVTEPVIQQVKKKSQTIQFSPLNDQIYSDNNQRIGIDARATSGLLVTLQSSTPAICTIENGAVQIKNVGQCSIVATQSGDKTYASAEPVSQNFQVKAGQFQFSGPTTLRDGVYGWPYGTGEDADSIVSISGQGTGIAPHTYRFAEGAILPPGLTLDPSGRLSASPLGQVGSYAFTVLAYDARGHQVGSRLYTLNVKKKPGCILFSPKTPNVRLATGHRNKIHLPGLGGRCTLWPGYRYTHNYLSLAMGGGQYDSIRYQTNDVVEVDGAYITLKKAGPARITATYLEDANHKGASDTYDFIVERAFSSVQLTVDETKIDSGKITLIATVIGYQPTGSVQFFSGINKLGSPVPLRGNVATLTVDNLVGGPHALHASYRGDVNNEESFSFTKSLLVTKHPQSIVGFAKPADLTYGAASFYVTARATSDLPVTFSAGALSVCTVTQEGLVTLEKNQDGVCHIRAHQVGNENYHPAKELTHTVTVRARKRDLNQSFCGDL